MTAKVTRDGRITVWDGGSLWAFDVPPHAPSQGNRMHRHHAVQITMGAGGTAHIRTEAGLLTDPVIAIAPDVPHAIEPEGRIALLFVDPEGRAGRQLRRLMDGAPTAGLPAPPGLVARLGRLWADPRPTDAEVQAIGAEILDGLLGPAVPEPAPDPRIARAIDWLGSRIESGVTAPAAASVACLSESRFRHLFGEEVGLPFKTFVLWRRLMRAVERVAAGESLTAAAHQAGFADSAHFSRTFRRMFGLPAASLEITGPEE
jgi:AraC family transcriptional regulator